MIEPKEINENIICVFGHSEIPESAENIILNDELLKKLHSLRYSDIKIYEYYYDNYENSIQKLEWIEIYSKHDYDMWIKIKSIFRIYMQNPKINHTAFQYNNSKNNIFNIYIVIRKYNKFQLDYIIDIKPEKVSLKKYFPKSHFYR